MAEQVEAGFSTGIKPVRPRLNSVVKDPGANPWKIVSSYNLHDEPIYMPVDTQTDSDLEMVELVDTSYSMGMPDLDRLLEEAKEIPIRERRFSVKTMGTAAQKMRRVSVARTIKPDNIITWDNPDDPQNPKNWPMRKKWTATVIVSLFTFMAPVASSMIAPCLAEIAKDLHVTSQTEMNLMLSIFILAFAIGPLLFGPLSEIYGRVRILQATNLFYLVWNLACGFAQTKQQMLAFRFLSGLGGSAPAAVGGGVLGDCWRPEQRGKAVAAYSLAPLLGPALGPILGGIIAENISWRWVFWISCIGDAIIQLFGVAFLQETYGPELLHRKAKRLRQDAGNQALRTEYESPDATLFKKLAQSLVRPFRLLFTQPIIQVLALYMSYIYGLGFLVYATFPDLWINRYHESIAVSGLNYISLSIGYALGTQIVAPLNDKVYAYLTARNDGIGRPEYRAPAMIPGSILVVAGLFLYGWSAQARLHWVVPNLGMVIFSVGTDISFQCATAYLIDCYTRFAASGIAAAVLVRSFCGFGFPLFAPALYLALGYGWGNTLLAFVALLLGVPAPFLLWKYGPALRAKSQYAAGE